MVIRQTLRRAALQRLVAVSVLVLGVTPFMGAQGAAADNPPVATPDSYTVNLGSTLSENVLANDTYPPGSTAFPISAPAGDPGFALSDNGSFGYTPAGFVGQTSFEYCIKPTPDGCVGANATVTITVLPAASDDLYDTAMDQQLTISAPGVLTNDETVPNSTAHETSDPDGAVTLDADGGFTFVPKPGFVGDYQFTYCINPDDVTCADVEATVTITVSPPTAADDEYAVKRNATLEVGPPGVKGNDSGIGSAFALLKSEPSHHVGVFELNSNGSFDYVPVTDYVGPDSFTYCLAITPAGAAAKCVSDIATVNITVSEEDVPPPNNDPDNPPNNDPPDNKPKLPVTGVKLGALLGAGGAVLAAGVGLVLFTRRRQGSQLP